MMKNILFALTIALSSTAMADILPAGEGAVIVSELQCSTAVNAKGTHDIIRSAKSRAAGVVDRCKGESCETFREISLRRSAKGIDVVCGDCDGQATIFGTIIIDSKLENSFNGLAKYSRLNEDGTVKKEHALNCKIDIVKNDGKTKADATPAPAVVTGTPSIMPGAVAPAAPLKVDPASSFLDDQFWNEQQKPKAKPRAKPTAKPKPKPTVKKPTTPSGNAGGAKMYVCTIEDGVRVRTSDLTDIAFEVEKGDPAILVKGGEKRTKTIGGKKYDFVEAQFPESKNKRGWIAENFLKAKCDGSTTVKPTPKPKPPVEPEPVEPTPTGGKLTMAELIKPNCARTKVLSAAKTTVRKIWGNRSNGGGQCALGVRQSLQASKVGGIQGGIGHAADFINRLKGFGYVDTGIRDPKKAPAGSVIVLGGPNTATYFRTGRMSRPYGNWVGHVTIKGDDGYYYTDGKTAEVAIGWSNDQNRRGTRTIIGVFVPGSDLVLKHRGTCDAMK